MDAAAAFGRANRHFLEEDYEEAVRQYTVAIASQDTAEYRSCRAAGHLKLGSFSEAIEDAEAALSVEPQSHMALHWKGVALFYMGDFAAAKAAFEESLRASPAAKAPRALWVRKCDAELSGSSLPLGGIAVEVSRAPVPAAVAPIAAAVSAVPAKAAADKEATAAEAASAAAGQEASAAVEAQSGLTISGRRPVKREWYQSDSTVFVTLFAKGVEQKMLKADFKEKELAVSFPLPGAAGEEYQMDIELFDTVDPAACTIQVSKVKVELALAKKRTGLQWRDLEKVEEAMYTPEQPAYPTSNAQKKDWSQIDREIADELKHEKPEGDEALNSLFKQIYDRADDETRRAMNKSFQTSGGTVLSTNWGEVARADYEGKDRPTPPEGQEWRDWKNQQQ